MKTENNNSNHLNEQGGGQIVFAPKNGKPGYRVKNPDGSLGQWIPVDKSEYGKPGVQADIDRYVKSGGKIVTPPKPKPKPEPAKLAPTQPAKPAPTQPTPKPTPTPSPKPSPKPTPTPSPKPTPTQPAKSEPTKPAQPAPAAPKPSPVADYMKAAAAARKSGDPDEMAKVRDMGMDIWRKSNPKLATAAAEKERIRGTAQTDNPLMKDMRSRLPVTPTVQDPKVKNLGPGNQSLTQNKFAGRSPTTKKREVLKKPTSMRSSMGNYGTTMGAGPTYRGGSVPPFEEYDIVLDYVLSEGHAETISEAHYVIMQMDSEHIQNIIEAQGEWFGGLRDRARASREAQMRSAQPTPKPGPTVSSPFAKPASRDDSGKLTTYGAGGGAAAERAGKSRAEVMKQGAKNLENKKPKNQGPDFGR